MEKPWRMALLAGALFLGSCHQQPDGSVSGSATAAAGIAWREGGLDDAFSEARESNKPILLYWGAKWCPPCNLMRQTLFKDPSFIAETRAFIPVHLDGDAQGAQGWGEKFGISGYPTVIILRPDLTEITRISGASAATSLARVLHLAATRTLTADELLKRAAVPRDLSRDDWLVLANFDWFDDPRHFANPDQAASFLKRLAGAAPDPAIQRQFALTGLALGSKLGDAALSTPQQTELVTLLPPILGNYNETKANHEVLSAAGAPLLLKLDDSQRRRALAANLTDALDRVAQDGSIPLGDRLETLNADIALSKAANGGKVSPPVQAKVRQRVAAANREASSPGLRQAVMPTAGDLLDQAGDPVGGEHLLEGELPHAIAPYYFMMDLAEMAEDQKDNAGALAWARKAAQAADGPATRVQWAILDSEFVLRLAPTDMRQVKQSADAVVAAFGEGSQAFAGRTRAKLQDWHGKVLAWSKAHGGGAVMRDLDARFAEACHKQASQSCVLTQG